MPSISIIDDITFSNWGPITTTFTPPASCVTGTNNILVAYTIPSFDTAFDTQCSSIGGWDCIPTGTDSKAAITGTIFDPNPTGEFQENYYSPGLYCPAGWATVGIAARDDKSSLSA